MSIYMNYDRREHETQGTNGAVLYIVGGRKQWVPKRAITKEDGKDKVVILTDWFARNEGIESDW